MESDKIRELIKTSKENSNKFALDSMHNYRIVCEDYIKLYDHRRNIESSLKNLTGNKKASLFKRLSKNRDVKIEGYKLLIQEIFEAEFFLMDHIWFNWQKIKTPDGIEEVTMHSPNMVDIELSINNLLQKKQYKYELTLRTISRILMFRKEWYWINKFEPLRKANEKHITVISSSKLFEVYKESLSKIYDRHLKEIQADPKKKSKIEQSIENNNKDTNTLASIYQEYFKLPYHTSKFTFDQINAFAQKNVNANAPTVLHKDIVSYLTKVKQRKLFLNYTIVLSQFHEEIFSMNKATYYENLSAIMSHQEKWTISCTRSYYLLQRKTNNDFQEIALIYNSKLRELLQEFKNDINKQFIKNILSHDT